MPRRTAQSAQVKPPLAKITGEFWLLDFTRVPTRERRAARYALQGYLANPDLQLQIGQEDFLASFWLLVRPLVDQDTLANIVDGIPDDENDPDDNSSRSHLRWLNEEDGVKTLSPAMRALVKPLLANPPASMLKRLQKIDGDEPTHPTLAALCRCLGLTKTERLILDFLEKRDIPGGRAFLRECGKASGRTNLRRLAGFLNVPDENLTTALKNNGQLRTMDLLDTDLTGGDLEDVLITSNFLDTLLTFTASNETELLHALIEPAPAPAWRQQDYPHLSREAARLMVCLNTAATHQEHGVNALFYGPPGTGKTEFALSIAEAAGLHAYLVKTDGDGNCGLDRGERLSAYRLAQRLLKHQQNAIVIFDEIEDVFMDSTNPFLTLLEGRRTHAPTLKGAMNRTLEDNPVPSIWITNTVDPIDPAFRRRFLLPVEFATPPRQVRRQMAERHLGGLGLPDALLNDLAADEKLMPAQLGAARRLLDLSGKTAADAGAVDMMQEGLRAQRRLLYGSGFNGKQAMPTTFDLSLLNLAGGITPAQLISALQRSCHGSLCFYGQPGTGKSAFAHVLAETLGRELVIRRASDLISCYVGGTEANLAQLFQSLDPERTVLLLDEADSFLRDRRSAHYRWETTQVNELLQQMEYFPGVFIATTNLMQEIDPAALRRFDFKLEFHPLTPAQRWDFFAREALATEPDPLRLKNLKERLAALLLLTAGDMATVCRQRDLLNEALTPEDFLLRLEFEHQHKMPSAVSHLDHKAEIAAPGSKFRH